MCVKVDHSRDIEVVCFNPTEAETVTIFACEPWRETHTSPDGLIQRQTGTGVDPRRVFACVCPPSPSSPLIISVTRHKLMICPLHPGSITHPTPAARCQRVESNASSRVKYSRLRRPRGPLQNNVSLEKWQEEAQG